MSAWTSRPPAGKADPKIVPPRPRIPGWKGLGADSEEKREPVSDIDTAVVDSLKVLDPKRPIREADIWRKSRTPTELFFTSSVTAYHNSGKVPHAHHFAWFVGGCWYRYRHACCFARFRTSSCRNPRWRCESGPWA